MQRRNTDKSAPIALLAAWPAFRASWKRGAASPGSIGLLAKIVEGRAFEVLRQLLVCCQAYNGSGL
jgi:hypothetical protein